jgi:hypothetical protein
MLQQRNGRISPSTAQAHPRQAAPERQRQRPVDRRPFSRLIAVNSQPIMRANRVGRAEVSVMFIN